MFYDKCYKVSMLKLEMLSVAITYFSIVRVKYEKKEKIVSCGRIDV